METSKRSGERMYFMYSALPLPRRKTCRTKASHSYDGMCGYVQNLAEVWLIKFLRAASLRCAILA